MMRNMMLIVGLGAALGLAATAKLAAPIDATAAAARTVMAALNLPVEASGPGRVTTVEVEVAYAAVEQYLVSSPVFGGPGWDRARLVIEVRLRTAGTGTEATVSARFERFGAESRTLLIPPAWMPAQSNGRLEAEVLAAVGRVLEGRAPVVTLGVDQGTRGVIPVPADDAPFIDNVAASRDTSSAGNQNETALAVDGQYVYGGWNDNRTGVYHVGFNRSTDGGLTWAARDTLMDHASFPEDGDPVVCVDDAGVVYYLWLAFNRSPYNGDIVMTKSTDNGTTWGPTQVLTPGTPGTLDDKPWLTIDGDDLFVTWYDYGGTNGFKFIRSADRGVTWTAPVYIGSGGNGTWPMHGRDSTVFVVWGVSDIKFNKSTDMGRTWAGQRTIITCPWSPRSTPYRLNNIPQMAQSVDRTVQYVAFADSRNRSGQLDVFVARSTDDGATWGTPVKVNDTPTNDTTLQFYPGLAVDPLDRVHVTWHDTRAGGNVIGQYYAYSTDRGLTFSPNYRVSDTSTLTGTFIGDYNACAADSNYVYALWCDTRRGSSNPDAMFSRAAHIGVTLVDAGVTAIVAPVDTVDSGAVVMPLALVRNFGTDPAEVPVMLAIGGSYTSYDTLTLAAGAIDTARFEAWTAQPLGWAAVRCTTMLAGDANPGNDRLADSVYVAPFTAVAEPGPAAAGLAIERIRPNPASRFAEVGFSLPRSGAASLVVYDAAGRAVVQLAGGRQTAGRHSARLDAAGLSAGVYWLKLESGSGSRTAKLAVQR
jgi:hypothetical protein